MDIWDKEKRSAVMARIRSKDTKPELVVRRYLWGRGYRYRKHVRGLPGTPDIVLRKYGVVIFVHGCFWHGHETHKRIPSAHHDYWEKKICRNKARDERDKEALRRIYVDGKGKPYKGGGKIDYVAGWYFKAAQFMAGTSIRAALVATNSITQGEQVAFFWEPLFKRFGIHIDFAHRTFRWDSEATLKAQVHVVIIGFSCAPNPKPRLLFYSDQAHQVQNITPYLLDTPTIFIKSRPRALCKVPPMVAGNKPTDGGAFFLTPSEREEVLQREPQIEPFIRPVMGSQEFIYGERRYCLWLTEATPQDIRSSTFLRERVESVRQFRLTSVNKATRNDAQTPHLFQQIHHKECPYILVPSVSSERRAYVPMGFVPAEVISTNLNLMVPGATLYHFAVLTSNVHMAWII